MAVTGMWGFEAGEVGTDSFSLNGTSSYSTGTVRTGARSVRCNPASGATGYASVLGTLATYKHFGLYIAPLPSADRSICGVNDGTHLGLVLKSSGVIDVYGNGVLIGSSTALSTNTWYWIGVRQLTGSSVVFLQIDGSDAVTGSGTISATDSIFGCFNT